MLRDIKLSAADVTSAALSRPDEASLSLHIS
jgi:hypothetical protein